VRPFFYPHIKACKKKVSDTIILTAEVSNIRVSDVWPKATQPHTRRCRDDSEQGFWSAAVQGGREEGQREDGAHELGSIARFTSVATSPGGKNLLLFGARTLPARLKIHFLKHREGVFLFF